MAREHRGFCKELIATWQSTQRQVAFAADGDCDQPGSLGLGAKVIGEQGQTMNKSGPFSQVVRLNEDSSLRVGEPKYQLIRRG